MQQVSNGTDLSERIMLYRIIAPSDHTHNLKENSTREFVEVDGLFISLGKIFWLYSRLENTSALWNLGQSSENFNS